jgi:hypothetical protein
MKQPILFAASFSAIVTFLIALSVPAHAYTGTGYHPHAVNKGFAVTKRNDTLRGYFGLMDDNRFYFSKERAGQQEELKGIDYKSIYVEMPMDKMLNKGGYIQYDFLPTKQYKPYRRIFSGKNLYYDHNLNDFALNRIYEVIIVNPANNGNTEFPPDFRGSKKVLIDYLNKQYKTSYSKKDFDNSIQVIEEIERHL